MPIFGADGNPELESDDVTQKVHPDAGKDWCFAYGEQEWINPDDFVVGGKNIKGSFKNYIDRATDDETKRTSCE